MWRGTERNEWSLVVEMDEAQNRERERSFRITSFICNKSEIDGTLSIDLEKVLMGSTPHLF